MSSTEISPPALLTSEYTENIYSTTRDSIWDKRSSLSADQYEQSPEPHQIQHYDLPFPNFSHVATVTPPSILPSQHLILQDSQHDSGTLLLLQRLRRSSSSNHDQSVAKADKTKEKFLCSQCRRELGSKSALSRHMREMHRYEGAYFCPPVGLVS